MFINGEYDINSEAFSYMQAELHDLEEFRDLTHEERAAFLSILEPAIGYYLDGCLKSFLYRSYANKSQ